MVTGLHCGLFFPKTFSADSLSFSFEYVVAVLGFSFDSYSKAVMEDVSGFLLGNVKCLFYFLDVKQLEFNNELNDFQLCFFSKKEEMNTYRYKPQVLS